MDGSRSQRGEKVCCMLLALKRWKGPQDKKCRWLLGAGKGKEMDCSPMPGDRI